MLILCEVCKVLDVDDMLVEHLVSRSQLGPRLVCPAIIVLRICDFHILMESQDFPCL